MDSKTMNEQRPTGTFRPSLRFFHANAKGTGSAVRMSLLPAYDTTDGCIMLTIANQASVGARRGPNPTYPRFDWENALCVKLDFNDLTKVLQVLRGACESINDGKGLYHTSAKGATSIRLTHAVDTVQEGYVLDVCRKTGKGGDDENRARIMFSSAEALGLCEALSGAMCFICFGMPMPVSRGAAAGQAEPRRMDDATAA